MRTLVCVSLMLSLQGCFFVYLPGSVVGGVSDALTGSFGNRCIAPNVKVGDQIMADGKLATVDRISGPSGRCSEPSPIRAQISYN